MMTPEVGSLIDGDFKLLCKLGQGGMGVVFLAEQLSVQRRVALKFLRIKDEVSAPREPSEGTLLVSDTSSSVRVPPPSIIDARSGPRWRRFAREAHLLAKMTHPNVVHVLAFGASDYGLYLAMEYVDGKTLAEVLADGPISSARVQGITDQILSMLCEAQSHHIVHRDLKPSNIMLVSSEEAFERVKVLDFGLAKNFDPEREEASSAALTAEASRLGTPRYMAPEQAAGHPLDRRADIYSLGLIVREMLTGVPPISGYPQKISLNVGGREAAVEAFLSRAHAFDPQQRFDSALEMLVAWRALTGKNEAPGAGVEPPAVALPEPWRALAEKNEAPGAGVEPPAVALPEPIVTSSRRRFFYRGGWLVFIALTLWGVTQSIFNDAEPPSDAVFLTPDVYEDHATSLLEPEPSEIDDAAQRSSTSDVGSSQKDPAPAPRLKKNLVMRPPDAKKIMFDGLKMGHRWFAETGRMIQLFLDGDVWHTPSLRPGVLVLSTHRPVGLRGLAAEAADGTEPLAARRATLGVRYSATEPLFSFAPSDDARSMQRLARRVFGDAQLVELDYHGPDGGSVDLETLMDVSGVELTARFVSPSRLHPAHACVYSGGLCEGHEPAEALGVLVVRADASGYSIDVSPSSLRVKRRLARGLCGGSLAAVLQSARGTLSAAARSVEPAMVRAARFDAVDARWHVRFTTGAQATIDCAASGLQVELLAAPSPISRTPRRFELEPNPSAPIDPVQRRALREALEHDHQLSLYFSPPPPGRRAATVGVGLSLRVADVFVKPLVRHLLDDPALIDLTARNIRANGRVYSTTDQRIEALMTFRYLDTDGPFDVLSGARACILEVEVQRHRIVVRRGHHSSCQIATGDDPECDLQAPFFKLLGRRSSRAFDQMAQTHPEMMLNATYRAGDRTWWFYPQSDAALAREMKDDCAAR